MNDKIYSGLSDVISGAVRKDSDYADIYVQSSASHSALYDDGRMDTLSSHRADGIGVRVVRGDSTAYADAQGTNGSSLAAAMREASSLSGVRLLCPAAPNDELEEDVLALPSLDVGAFRDLDAKFRAECRWLRQITFRSSTSVSSVAIVRGDGGVVRETRRYTTFTAHVVLERDGELKTGHERRAFRVGADEFWSAGIPSSAESVARAAIDRAILMLDAVPCPAGEMTVLLDGEAGGTMIHEACGHALEADIIRKDFSVFRDKIGERVARPGVTIVDDATLPGMFGSYLHDDEGTPAARTVLVEDGILRGYMTDVISSRLDGLPLTGNGRRESYRCAPMPRMSNTFVVPGTTPKGELLDRVKDGLLVKKMGGGEVDPTSGDFVFYVSEGYLIKDGKVGSPVKGATLIGNGPRSLERIAGVGDELVLDSGICGKSGQSAPVTDGQPTLLIDGITVGGSDTDDVR